MGRLEEERALLDLLQSGEVPHDLEFSERLFGKFKELLRTDRIFVVGNKKIKREILGGYVVPLGRAIAKQLLATVADGEAFAARIRDIDFDDTVIWKDMRKFKVIMGLLIFRKRYERAKAHFRQKK